MSGLPEPEDLAGYVDSLFTEDRRRRALDWASTPEGRETIEAHRLELQRHQPVDPRAPGKTVGRR